MKKRNLGLALALAGAATATPASVGMAVVSPGQQIVIGANATKYCSFSADGAFSGLDNIGVDSTARPTSIVHVQNPVTAGGFMREASFTFLIQTTCNAPSEFRLRTLNGGMKNPAPTPVSGSWLSRIDYSAHVTLPALAGATSSLNTNGLAGAQSSLRTYGVPYSGQLQVTFETIDNLTAPLVAGNYSDTLTIAVNPQ
jgi:hypothetical protein